jgi:hypothetical protein
VTLLIDFGRPRPEFKRLFPSKKIRGHRRKKWGKPASTDETTDKQIP